MPLLHKAVMSKIDILMNKSCELRDIITTWLPHFYGSGTSSSNSSRKMAYNDALIGFNFQFETG